MNEEGKWIGRGNITSQFDESRHDDITVTNDAIHNEIKEQKPESVKRKLADIKAELSERLGWESEDKR